MSHRTFDCLLPCPLVGSKSSCLSDGKRDDDEDTCEKLEVVRCYSDEITILSSEEHETFVDNTAKDTSERYEGDLVR